ncbi:methyltransferase domain-containing protein [Streptomyces sp. NPDC097640]|uniref:class I SAM-dependent methyltransferase n=1 Tax=Streptomyces sp. NPDC097640 TaxID=3157229 RepID=UPI00332803EC
MHCEHASTHRPRAEVVSLLDVQPTDRVLEVGFGPGLTIAELARRASRGHVYGIDHSDAMVRQTRKRNAAAIRTQRVTLLHTSVDRAALRQAA